MSTGIQSVVYKELVQRLGAAAGSNKSIETELATSQRIIRQVTDGIYREPWAAFRELVANSYDADATEVFIETNAPDFKQITVRDNGIGMSVETLAYMLTSIGGSSKRTIDGAQLHTTDQHDPDLSPSGRPLIGKIGIGLFAVAQLTQHFQIITKVKDQEYRLSAMVKLRTVDDHMDTSEGGDEKYVAGHVEVLQEKVPPSEVAGSGTEIVLYSLKPEITRVLQSVQRWKVAEFEPDSDSASSSHQHEPEYHIGLPEGALGEGEPGKESNLPWNPGDSPEDKFRAFLDVVKKVSPKKSNIPGSLEPFDEYLRLIWKLSLSIPIHYIDQHPFDLTGDSKLLFFKIPNGPKAQAEQEFLGKKETVREHFELTAENSAQDFPFMVTIDGIKISRPISLPTKLVSKRQTRRVKHPVMMVGSVKKVYRDNDLKSAGGQLSFDAYLYWNNKIVPKDTAGALIRVHGASGVLFDRTFLNYQVSEQTRLRQTTVEIFVNEGLDAAINIDRESFNFSHPHYIFIQKWLHTALRLLANRLKAIAKEDLDHERVEKKEEVRKLRLGNAYKVWERRFGEETDDPLPEVEGEKLPLEVGGTEIQWHDFNPPDPDKATAIAIVLEAYGVLSGLDERDRNQLVVDILSIFDESNDG